MADVAGPLPPRELSEDALYQLWRSTAGGHKWSHYFAVYEAVFAARRTSPLRVLEIGVHHGAGLQLWRRYFAHPETLIVGIDISADCRRYDAPASGIRVRIGSQSDPAFLAAVVAEFGPFDLIIDDGSHHTTDQIASFNQLFGAGLTDQGIYLVEDLHANYWLPWRDSANSFIDLCKLLVERMHEHYRRTSHAVFFPQQRSRVDLAAIDVPAITPMLGEIRFFDSIVAIHKRQRRHVPYYMQVPD